MSSSSESRSALRRRLTALLAILAAFAVVAAACGGGSGDAEDSSADTEAAETEAAEESDPEPEPEEEEPAEEEPAAEEEEAMEDAAASFVSLQFAPVEEAEKFRAILDKGGFDVTIGEEGPTIDQIKAGSGSIDVVGALHGRFPPLTEESNMTNMADVLDDLQGDRTFAPSFIESGLLGSDDFLAYVPWAQATYIMAATPEAIVTVFNLGGLG